MDRTARFPIQNLPACLFLDINADESSFFAIKNKKYFLAKF
jgi:hypothetical protein